LLKRTSSTYINEILEKNSNWKILDIGCGYTANKNATVIADIQDLSNFYKEKKFIKIGNKKLPFKDKEFDFVISSHVIEHVEDFEFFINELERISSKGYIELPSRLGDNLVFENNKDHIWWFFFDDISNKLLSSKKNQLIEPFLTVSTARYFEKIFPDSFTIQLYWEDKIDYLIDDKIRKEYYKPTSFFTIIRKYFSKKIRNLIRQGIS
jgi:ubiquinone/menaquinone biosynthesis C-methylase UbiE